ncbi:helix-turn-helix domain-containing protein [Actinomadura sp. 3N407]|uniref:helix-turn-helix domain-containing protein n=1 Tax=Actinomadura sp. 3N407 TaxID=3457423 RepID=UPI003FCEA67C
MGENRARIFFGTELRRMRDAAGLTGKELADALGCTPQWISTMESGRKVSEQSAHDLDTYFKLDGYFYRLWKLANEIEVQTVLPPGFSEYAEREKKAASIRIYSPLVISGLFQSEGYAHTVISTIENNNTSELVSKRMERQSVLTKINPPRVWLTLDEAALRRTVGSPDIMREQFIYLLEVSERSNVMLNVIPESVGYHAGLEGTLTLLSFTEGPDVAYVETTGEGLLIEQPAKVKDKVVRWDLLRGHVLPAGESRAMLRTLLENL